MKKTVIDISPRETMKSTAWVRWWKFNAVGAMGIAVQLAVVTLLKTGLGVNYLLATALAVEAAVVHNFFWHERYTWADRESSARFARLAKFNLSTGTFSILGNLLAMKFFVDGLGVNYFAGNLLSITVCSILNYLVADRFVFLKPAPHLVQK
jgi:putative flippase GtrA